ncbi:hypothetical protein [Streptomyces abikoensis]|uniref:4Fe-4S Wbl-type domain-containing protein n=1 Tax=Streptomyces abikoensis TaxID=97398 RepID=A0ABW7T4X5_9ACTN
MIDPARVTALAQQPSPRTTSSRRAQDRALILNNLHHASDPLARPIAWSAAACVTEEAKALPATASAAARLCAPCPILEACRTAFLAGAPAAVRQWREHLAEGQPIAA